MRKRSPLAPIGVWVLLGLGLAPGIGCTRPPVVHSEATALAATQSASPKANFPSGPGRPGHVVFIVDRSGSTMEVFDEMRSKILSMVASLKYDQDFHVIFFGGRPVEMDARNLVEASFENKVSCARFLGTVQPEGLTDPIQAINRAFDVLSRASRKPGKLIILLTDGDFPDNAKVIQALRELNAQHAAKILVFRCGDRKPGAEDVLKTIARENGGIYEYLPFNSLP